MNEDKDKLYFCRDWKKSTQLNDVKVIDRYTNNGIAGTYFVDFAYYTPSSSYLNAVYPIPQYQSIAEEVNTDIDIST